MNDRCREEVLDGMGFHSHQCSRKAVKDGYCKQHHPDAVKERDAKSRARWEEKRKEEPWYVLREVKEKLAAAEAENNDLKAKVAQWEEKARQWMLSDDAKKQLDGYREMGDQIAALRAEVEQWKQASDDGAASLLACHGEIEKRDEEIETLRAEVERKDAIIKALVKAGERFEEVRLRHQRMVSPDMGGKHGFSIHVPQGSKGDEYREAQTTFRATLDAAREKSPN